MADFARPEQHLPLKIGQRDVVVVDDRQTADARRREILDPRSAYAARADHRDARFQQPRLSRAADFLPDDVARNTEIGRASWRARVGKSVWVTGVGGALK